MPLRSIDGVPVVNDAGEWVGPAPRVAWTDIIDIPPDFADGVDDDSDTDSFASLGMSCVDGDVPVWDGILGAWGCGEDTVLTADEVDAIVADNGYAMADDAFSRSFFDLLDVPADLLDGDDDTQLTEPEVDAMVEDNGYATTDELFSGSYADLSDRPDLFSGRFADLIEVPAGLSDGDDDTQLTEDQVDEMVADNGYRPARTWSASAALARSSTPAAHGQARPCRPPGAVHRPRAQAYGTTSA